MLVLRATTLSGFLTYAISSPLGERTKSWAPPRLMGGTSASPGVTSSISPEARSTMKTWLLPISRQWSQWRNSREVSTRALDLSLGRPYTS